MEDNRIKILFVIHSLTGGGAEKILIEILKGINRERFIPLLLLLEKKGAFLDQVPGDVKIYDLKKKTRFCFIKLIYKSAYKIFPEIKPGVVVSFSNYTDCITLIAKKISFSHKPLIISVQHVCYSQWSKNQRMGGLQSRLLRETRPLINKIIAVSKGVKEDLVDFFNDPSDKVQVIYNGFDTRLIADQSRQAIDDCVFEGVFTIIACGRLKYVKNYPFLLTAFSRVIKEKKARLLILGEGEEENNLKSLAHKLGLQENVEFLGFQNNPFKFMAKADIFVLPSLWEGFGNVIIEAMVCGVAVIATDCPCGPSEIITDGVNGLLVPVGDIDAFVSAILRLLKDEPFRRCLAEAGKKRAEDFKVETMVESYEKVFQEICLNR